MLWFIFLKHVLLFRPHLLHVLSDRILLQELCAFPRVKPFGVSQELSLKVFLVDGQSGTFSEGIVLIETQLNCERWRATFLSNCTVSKRHVSTSMYPSWCQWCRTIGLHHSTDESSVDGFSVPLFLDQLQYCICDLRTQPPKKTFIRVMLTSSYMMSFLFTISPAYSEAETNTPSTSPEQARKTHAHNKQSCAIVYESKVHCSNAKEKQEVLTE